MISERTAPLRCVPALVSGPVEPEGPFCRCWGCEDPHPGCKAGKGSQHPAWVSLRRPACQDPIQSALDARDLPVSLLALNSTWS